MKSLRAFWHWVDNERPTVQLYATKALETLSELGREALMAAERHVGARVGDQAAVAGDALTVTDEGLISLRPALRDLSFAIGAGLERMHEQVAKDCFAPAGTRSVPLHTDGLKMLRNLGEWIPPVMPRDDYVYAREYQGRWSLTQQQLAHTGDTFRGVECTPDEQLRGFRIGRDSFDPAEVQKRLDRLVYGTPAPPPQCDECGIRAGHKVGCSRFLTVETPPIRPQLSGDVSVISPPIRLQTSGDVVLQGITVKGAGSVTVSDHTGDVRAYHEQVAGPVYHGRVRSNYDATKRRLTLYTTLCLVELEEFRGLSPRTIILRGAPNDYPRYVREYLPEVLGPMIADGAVLQTPNSTEWQLR